MKVVALILVAVAIASADLLQDIEDFVDDRNLGDTVDEIKATLNGLIKECEEDDGCQKVLDSIVGELRKDHSDVADAVDDFLDKRAITATAIAGAKACLANPACSAAAKAAATTLLNNAGVIWEGAKKAGEAIVDGAKNLADKVKNAWKDWFGKRDVDRRAILSAVVALAKKCLASRLCSGAAQLAASSLISAVAKGSKSAIEKAKKAFQKHIIPKWKEWFGKRDVDKRVAITATAIAAAQACIANPLCTAAAKAAATALLSNAGVILDGAKKAGEAIVDGAKNLADKVKNAWKDWFGKRDVDERAITATAIAGAKACLANPACSAAAKAAATTLLNNAGVIWEGAKKAGEAIVDGAKNLADKVKNAWKDWFGKRSVSSHALDLAKACLSNPDCTKTAKDAARLVLKGVESAVNVIKQKWGRWRQAIGK